MIFFCFGFRTWYLINDDTRCAAVRVPGSNIYIVFIEDRRRSKFIIRYPIFRGYRFYPILFTYKSDFIAYRSVQRTSLHAYAYRKQQQQTADSSARIQNPESRIQNPESRIQNPLQKFGKEYTSSC